MFLSFFFLLLRLPPSTPLFPYTTLFRSLSLRGRHPGRLYLGVMRQSLRAEADSLSIFNGSTGFHRLRMRRSEEHTSELQSLTNLVCRLLLEKKKKQLTQRVIKKVI